MNRILKPDQRSSLEILTSDYGDLRPAKLSHRVADLLRSQIFSGVLLPGSKLPSESELLKIFKVSRPTLREAMRIIEAESLIEIGRGMRTGAIVLGPNAMKVAEYATFLLASQGVTLSDLHDARAFFEPEIIRSLTKDRLGPTLLALRKTVASMEQAIDETQYFRVAAGSRDFHNVLANAAPNKTIGLLIGIFQNISEDAYATVILEQPLARREILRANMIKTVAGYSLLCGLLEKGKFAEASAFWHIYMERAAKFMIKTGMGARRIVLLPLPASGAPVRNRQIVGVSALGGGRART